MVSMVFPSAFAGLSRKVLSKPDDVVKEPKNFGLSNGFSMDFTKMLLTPWVVMQTSRLVDISQLPDSGCHQAHLLNKTIGIAADAFYLGMITNKQVLLTACLAFRYEGMRCS